MSGTLARKATCLAVALQLAAAPLGAQSAAGIAALFPARPSGYLTDMAGAVPAPQASGIDSLAAYIRRATGAEIAIAVLPTIKDYAAVDVAVAIGRAWGVGAQARIGDARRNAGLVLLLVPKNASDPNSGQVFIATGQGLEGIITDAAAGAVRDLMRPSFSAGDYGAGLLIGVQELGARIAQDMGVADSTLQRAPARSSGGSRFPFGLLVIIIWVLLSIIRGGLGGGRGSGGRRRRGPFIIGPTWGGGGFGGLGGGGGGGGFGGFGGGGGFSGGGSGGRF